MATASLEPGRIDYALIGAAVEFYRQKGYRYIEVPWLVAAPAFDITCPPGVKTFDTYAGRLVASGEQSFLHMMVNKELPPGRYQCVTPCFRDEPLYDATHKMYFLKVELIDTESLDFEVLLRDAMEFFNARIPCRREDFPKGTSDIVTVDGGIELGSFGKRDHPLSGPWAYGTGCAEPRLSYCLQRQREAAQTDVPSPAKV